MERIVKDIQETSEQKVESYQRHLMNCFTEAKGILSKGDAIAGRFYDAVDSRYHNRSLSTPQPYRLVEEFVTPLGYTKLGSMPPLTGGVGKIAHRRVFRLAP